MCDLRLTICVASCTHYFNDFRQNRGYHGIPYEKKHGLNLFHKFRILFCQFPSIGICVLLVYPKCCKCCAKICSKSNCHDQNIIV